MIRLTNQEEKKLFFFCKLRLENIIRTISFELESHWWRKFIFFSQEIYLLHVSKLTNIIIEREKFITFLPLIEKRIFVVFFCKFYSILFYFIFYYHLHLHLHLCAGWWWSFLFSSYFNIFISHLFKFLLFLFDGKCLW